MSLPKYCVRYKSSGIAYVRFVRGKGPGVYRKTLAEPVGSPAFYVEYANALADSESHVAPRQKYIHVERRAGAAAPGLTLGDLITNYRRSAEWRELRATTKTTYSGMIASFESDHGHRPLDKATPEFFKKLFRESIGTPSRAFNLRKRLAAIYRAAEDASLIEGKDNPLLGVRAPKYRAKGLWAWSEDDVTRYLAHHKAGTVEHLAFSLALETGSRRGDLVRIGHDMLASDPATGHVGHAFAQEQTGSDVFIPTTEAIFNALVAAAQRGNLGKSAYLKTQYGKPFTVNGLGNLIRDAARDAGVTAPLHGLRKLAITRLLDRGYSTAQAMAISGHTSFQEFQKYVGTRDRRALAVAGAMLSAKSSNFMNSGASNSEFTEQDDRDISLAAIALTPAERAKLARALALPTGFEPVF